MKAKEYAQRIIDLVTFNNSPGSIETEIIKVSMEILIDLVHETEELCKIRHCKYDSAFIAVFDEINTKWIKICEIVDDYCSKFVSTEIHVLNKEYFSEVLIEVFEEKGILIRNYWKPKRRI